MNIEQKTLFDIEFSAVTQMQAVQAILHWTEDNSTTARRVVTPNVNLTMLQKNNPAFRQVLNSSDLVLVDGMPIYWASRLFKKSLPEVVTGSDLVPAIFATYQNSSRTSKLPIYLLGAAEGVAQKAALKIMEKFPSIEVRGVYSPPHGFENDLEEGKAICTKIWASKARLLVIGLGSPKQELWAAEHLHRTGIKVAICAGATIDFIAGEKKRAPAWISKAGLECVFRVLSEPRRLAKRYLNDGLALPGLFWAEYRKSTRLSNAKKNTSM